MTTAQFQWWHVPVAVAFAVVVVVVVQPELFNGLLSRRAASDILENKPVAGSFRSAGEPLGAFTLPPSACLDGHERGFQGVALQFAAGNPIQEIRVDTERAGDNVVEVRLADQAGTILRAHEPQCRAIEGHLTRSNVTFNGRPMVRLEGSLKVDCPTLGLVGEARFDGCLPLP